MEEVKHLTFTHRKKIEDMFLKWSDEKGYGKMPMAVVAYMQLRGWLNEDKILEDLKEVKEDE